MGATAAQNQFGSAAFTIQVYSHGQNEWKLFVAPIFLSTGTFFSTRSTRLEEPPLVSVLAWRRGGLVNEGNTMSIFRKPQPHLFGMGVSSCRHKQRWHMNRTVIFQGATPPLQSETRLNGKVKVLWISTASLVDASQCVWLLHWKGVASYSWSYSGWQCTVKKKTS